MNRKCLVEGCKNRAYGQGLCSLHLRTRNAEEKMKAERAQRIHSRLRSAPWLK